MEQQQTSAAHAFFQAHKDLFQYEKYASNQDPFQTENCQVDGGAVKSFLEQYREIDRECQSVPALSELRFSLLHPPTRRYSITNLAVSTTPAPSPEFVTLQATASILEKFSNPQHEPIRSHVFANSLQHTSQHTQPQPALRVAYECTEAPQYPSPDRVSVSKAPADSLGRPFLLQQPRSPVRLSVEPKLKNFSLPKLTELLIDRETRAAASTHKSWDEAHKIEVLVGSKCVGRVSAASRNIPPSIRSCLRASANVSVRRERLYDLLHRDYDELSKRYTQ